MGARPERPLAGMSVLIVDDNEDSLQLLEHTLTYYGALTVTAGGGREGLERLRQLRVDVIISDISMPGFSGYDFIEAVRALPSEDVRNIPAIALTAFDEPYARAAARGAGFQAYVVKPVDLPLLVEEVVRLVGRRDDRTR